MILNQDRATWLSKKGVVLLDQGESSYRVISPVSDISVLKHEGTEIAPILPNWVLAAAFSTRIEGFVQHQLDTIPRIAALSQEISHEFFFRSWEPNLENYLFDAAIGVSGYDDEVEERRNEQFVGMTFEQAVCGTKLHTGLPEMVIDCGFWLTWEGIVPMLHYLLGRYSAETVLPQVFAEAKL